MLICAPFHSTSNAPVGMAYLSSFLETHGYACPLVDLSIEGREFLTGMMSAGSAEASAWCRQEMFSLGRRNYAAEALTWAWLHPEGLAGLLRGVKQHPSELLRRFWQEQALDKVEATPHLRVAMDQLHQWLKQRARELVDASDGWIGFSAVITNLAATIFLAREMRALAPDLRLYLGGAYINSDNAPGLLHALQVFDAVVPAPAYEPFLQVLKHPPSRRLLSPIPGACTWSGSTSRVVMFAPSTREIDMNELPPANWSSLPLSLYESGFCLRGETPDFSAWYPTIPVQTSRGCSFSRCRFCHNVVDYPKYRMQSPERVATELAHQIAHTKSHGFFFTDDEFAGSRRRVLEICDSLVALDQDVRFFCWVRLDSLDRELLERMYAAGGRQLFIGCEAIDDQLLKLMNKGYDSQLAMRQLSMLHDFGEAYPDFTYTFNLIVDYPGETIDSVRNTLSMIASDPQLFVDRVAACCQFQLYERTPEYSSLAPHAVGCLEAVVPPGLSLPSFRYLFEPLHPETRPRRLEIWSAITEFVQYRGANGNKSRERSIYV